MIWVPKSAVMKLRNPILEDAYGDGENVEGEADRSAGPWDVTTRAEEERGGQERRKEGAGRKGGKELDLPHPYRVFLFPVHFFVNLPSVTATTVPQKWTAGTSWPGGACCPLLGWDGVVPVASSLRKVG